METARCLCDCAATRSDRHTGIRQVWTQPQDHADETAACGSGRHRGPARALHQPGNPHSWPSEQDHEDITTSLTYTADAGEDVRENAHHCETAIADKLMT